MTSGTGEVGVAFNALMAALGPIGDGIVSIFDAVGVAWDKVTGFFDSDESEAGKSWGASIIATTVLVIEAITGMVNWIRKEWNAMLEWFDGPGKDEFLLSWLWAPVAGIFGWITGAWDAVLAWLGVPEEVFAWLGDVESGIFNWVSEAWQTVLNWFSGPGKDQTILSWLFEPHAGLFSWIRDAFEGVLYFLGAPQSVFDWLGVVEGNFFQSVTNAFTGMVNGIRDAWLDTLDWFLGLGELATGIILNPIKNAFQDVMDWLASFSFADAGAALIQTLVDGIVSVKDLIYEQIKDSLGFIGKLLPRKRCRRKARSQD